MLNKKINSCRDISCFGGFSAVEKANYNKFKSNGNTKMSLRDFIPHTNSLKTNLPSPKYFQWSTVQFPRICLKGWKLSIAVVSQLCSRKTSSQMKMRTPNKTTNNPPKTTLSLPIKCSRSSTRNKKQLSNRFKRIFK